MVEENLVAMLASETDRVWINDSLLKNNDEALKSLSEATKYNENLLLESNNINSKELTKVETYLLNLAESSFKKECTIYSKEKGFLKEMQDAFSEAKRRKKASLFLADSGLGKKLTNLFYTGTTANKGEDGLTELLQKLAQLDVQQLASDVVISNEQAASNAIANVINNFFITAKKEKNDAIRVANGNDNIIRIFQTIYDESNIFTVLSGNSLAKKDLALIVKTQLEEAKKDPSFLASTSRAERAKMLASTEKEAAEITENIIETIGEDLVEKIYSSISNYLDKNQKEQVLEAIRAMLAGAKISGKETLEESKELRGVSLKSGGKQIKGVNGISFNMAAYRINTEKIGSTIGQFLLKDSSQSSHSFNIQSYLNSVDDKNKKALDDLLINSLNTFNEALCKYLGGANSIAWQYYQQYFLNNVIILANRDIEKSLAGEVLSNIHGELNRIANTLPILSSYNKIVAELSELEKSGWINQTQAKELLEKCKDKFNMKDSDDRNVYESIRKSLDNNNIKEGMENLLKRMKAKRSGYSNLNGYIGEVFLTAVLKTIFQETDKDMLEQRGASFNLKSQDAHVDIRFKDIGIQSKMYQSNNNALYETIVNFNTDDAVRYLRSIRSSGDSASAVYGDETTAFRFFLANYPILDALKIGQQWNTDNLFLEALNLRIANFFRYTDGLSSEDLSSIANNFYLINMNIVPASVIFLKMYELIAEAITEGKESNKVFFELTRKTDLNSYTGSDLNDYKLTKSSNLVKQIKDQVKFKSFTMNLSELGVESFTSRK